MSTSVYMTITGSTQKDITKSASSEKVVGKQAYQKEFEDTVHVLEYEDKTYVKAQAQSGQAVGERTHEPVKIKKLLDKSSPQLFQALTKREILEEVVLTWYSPLVNGVREAYYQVKLENALVVDITGSMGKSDDSDYSNAAFFEEVSITFSKIHKEHLIAGVAATDDWAER